MNVLQSMRKKLGISQSALAEWLGISRGRLAMIETNRRPLPGAYLLKLAELDSKTKNSEQASRPAMEENLRDKSSPDAQLNDFMLSRCSLELRKLNNRLSQMQSRYSELEESRKLMEGFSEDPSMNGEGEVYWRIQYENVLSKLERCGPEQQARIARRIVMLSAEALHYRLSG